MKYHSTQTTNTCEVISETMWKIQGTNSIKDHAVILESLGLDEFTIMGSYFQVALDDSKPTNISKLDKIKVTSSDQSDKTADEVFYSLIHRLMKQKSATGDDKTAVANFLAAYADSPAIDLYRRAFLRQSIGIGTTVINEVWKKRTGKILIGDFEVMLAPNKQPALSDLVFPLNVQPKLDGFRAVLTPDGFFSRNGKPFANVTLRAATTANPDYVFDGELYFHGENFSANVGFLTREDAPLPAGLHFVVFDVIPIDDFNNRTTPKDGYKERLKTLESLVLNSQVCNGVPVQLIANHVVNDLANLQDLYDTYLLDGYEGVMLKSDGGQYKFGRCTLKQASLMKYKPVETFDLKITGFEIGEAGSRNERTLGKFFVSYKGKEVGVGSGMNDELRAEVWANQGEYLGKTIEVKSQGETEKGSLRFPVFVRFRPDKD